MVRVHFLDVGADEYGDAILCQLGAKRVLIDGAHPGDQNGGAGHPSIPAQLTELLQDATPVHIDLLVVTHAHLDHIGCLPSLVQDGTIQVEWALVADPGLGWGRLGNGPDAAGADPRVEKLAAGVREEVLSDRAADATVSRFLSDAVSLEDRYKTMLGKLEDAGARVVRYGPDSSTALLEAFEDVELEILGPSDDQLRICAEEIARRSADAVERVTDLLRRDADAPDTHLYRLLVHSEADSLDSGQRPGPAINLQSIVTSFKHDGVKMLFAGDMQFAKAQVGADGLQEQLDMLRARIRGEAPFEVVKLSHHGSDNAFDEGVLNELGASRLFGICAGETSSSHPNTKVLRLLEDNRNRLDWWRTDRNGLVSMAFNGTPQVKPAKGKKDDPTPPGSDVQPTGPPPTVVELAGSATESVEVTIKVSIEVERQPSAKNGTPKASDAPIDLRIGGGRTLPRLLFVTNRDALAANTSGETVE